MRSAALAHAVELVEWNVQTEEEFQGVFGNRSSARVALGAAVQPQGLAHFFEDELFGYLIAERCLACCSTPERHKPVQILTLCSLAH